MSAWANRVSSAARWSRVFVLPGGFRLLVGRDLEDRETIARIFGWALITSLFWITLIGMLGGLFVARRVLRRVDAMNESAQTIMEGNLATRLPVGRSNDELDRLAPNLNSMLERIQELMAGLRKSPTTSPTISRRRSRGFAITPSRRFAPRRRRRSIAPRWRR